MNEGEDMKWSDLVHFIHLQLDGAGLWDVSSCAGQERGAYALQFSWSPRGAEKWAVLKKHRYKMNVCMCIYILIYIYICFFWDPVNESILGGIGDYPRVFTIALSMVFTIAHLTLLVLSRSNPKVVCVWQFASKRKQQEALAAWNSWNLVLCFATCQDQCSRTDITGNFCNKRALRTNSNKLHAWFELLQVELVESATVLGDGHFLTAVPARFRLLSHAHYRKQERLPGCNGGIGS